LIFPIGEQRRFESLSNPAGVPNHPTYVEPNLAYVNPNLALPRSDRVRGTREHSTPPSSPFARRVHATLARSTPSVRVAAHVVESQDRAYRGQVASTINSQPSRPSTDRSLIDIVGDTTLRLHS